MKRWRCPDCGAVHTCRPHTHWRRFWTSIAAIVIALAGILGSEPDQPPTSRQNRQYWRHGYRIQSMVLGLPGSTVQELLDEGIIAATHSLTDRAIRHWPQAPHPRLAATGPP
jgi:hypothetical protein